LAQLSGKELLEFRIVSSSWKDISSSICRQRKTSLRRPKKWLTGRLEPPLSDVFTIFDDRRNLPWSSLNYNTNSEWWDIRKQFLTFFGSQVFYLQFPYHYRFDDHGTQSPRYNYQSVINVLKKTTNLRSLQLQLPQKQKWLPEKYSTVNNISLLTLSRLKVAINNDGNVDFLEHLIQHRLDYIEAEVTRAIADDYSDKLSILLAKSRSRFLKMFIEYKSNSDILPSKYAAEKLAAHTIELSLFEPKRTSANTENHFGPFQDFLSGCAVSLEMLKLSCYCRGGSSVTPFYFPPCLSVLTSLQIYFGSARGTTWWGDDAFMANFFSRINSNLFPALKKITITIEEEWDVGWLEFGPPPATSIFECCPLASFECVRELVLESNYRFLFMDNWNRVFPNLKQLSTTIRNSKQSFERVFANTNLEELTLEILVMDENDCWDFVDREYDDVNDLISGIQGADYFYKHQQTEHARRQVPSIMMLTSKYFFTLHLFNSWIVQNVSRIVNKWVPFYRSQESEARFYKHYRRGRSILRSMGNGI